MTGGNETDQVAATRPRKVRIPTAHPTTRRNLQRWRGTAGRCAFCSDSATPFTVGLDTNRKFPPRASGESTSLLPAEETIHRDAPPLIFLPHIFRHAPDDFALMMES